MKKHNFIILMGIVFVGLLLMPDNSLAQCAMCKATVESSGNGEGGLNNAILYLMTIPYIALGVVGFVWFKNSKKQ